AQTLSGVEADTSGGAFGTEAAPRSRGILAEGGGEFAELFLGQQRRMILRVTLNRKAIALDRVSDDHRGPGVVDLFVRLPQRVQVVPAQVGDRGGEPVIVEFGYETGDFIRAGAVAGQPCSQLVCAASQQSLVF